MKAYIISIIGAALVSVGINALTPDGKNGGLSKHTRFLCALVLLCVLIAPFLNFIKGLTEQDPSSIYDGFLTDAVPDAEVIFKDKLSSYSASLLESKLSELISDHFSIDEDLITVRAEYVTEEESLRFTRIVVILSGGAIFENPYRIEKYVTEQTSLPCDCVI